MSFDFSVLFIFLNIFSISNSQFSSNGVAFLWSDQKTCQSNQFYNPLSLSCVNCPSGTAADGNHLVCQCSPGQRLANWTGGQISCEPCTENWATSYDGLSCVQCLDGNNATVPRDLTTGYCPACKWDEIQVKIGTAQRCSKCPSGTAPDGQKLECVLCENAECFCHMNPSTCTSTDANSNIPSEIMQNFQSAYIKANLPFAKTMCERGDLQQCQHLANLCVLQNYSRDMGSACAYLEAIQRTPAGQSIAPALFYYNTEASIELYRENAIDAIFTVEENGTNSYLDVIAASYALNGTFLGFIPLNTGILQVCPTIDSTIRGGYLFGRQFDQKCEPSVDEVLNYVARQSETTFYELFLRYIDGQGRRMVYPIPIVNQAIRDGPEYVNHYGADRNSRWKLTRRFFVADVQKDENTNGTWLIRVPTEVSLQVQMQLSRDGKIFPPYLIVRYDEFLTNPSSNFVLEQSYSGRFSIQYSISSERHDKTIEILMAVFCSTSVLWAALYAYSWFRRSGKPMLDLSTLIKLVLYECEVISNIFLLVMGCMAVWITFAYKLQKHMVYVLLSYDQEWSFLAYMIAALALKTVSLFHTYITLALNQTFFVDWERSTVVMEAPRVEEMTSLESKKKRKPPVIWRTYLIANEWNELQNYRKTSIACQMLFMLFVLEFLNFKDYAIIQPGFARGDQPSEYASSRMSRFAVDLVAYIIFGMAQWITMVMVIERVVDPFRNFMDLCSVANISVVALTNPLRGYYIHGRSVHGLADTDMMEMNTFLQRERDNLCSLRGLESGSELQTFVMNLPRTFRDKYEEITSPLRTPPQNVNIHHSTADRNTAKIENTSKVYGEINQFFKDIIDHANYEIDYTVTDSKLIEEILELEMRDTSKIGTFTRYGFCDLPRKYLVTHPKWLIVMRFCMETNG